MVSFLVSSSNSAKGPLSLIPHSFSIYPPLKTSEFGRTVYLKVVLLLSLSNIGVEYLEGIFGSKLQSSY